MKKWRKFTFWLYLFFPQLTLVQVWETLCENLTLDIKTTPVLLSDYGNRSGREKMIEVMFEKFSAPKLTICHQAALALYTMGKLTGTVLDCGHTHTSVTPVYEGFVLPNSTMSLDIGGKYVTEQLCKLLNERGYWVEDMKEYSFPNEFCSLTSSKQCAIQEIGLCCRSWGGERDK